MRVELPSHGLFGVKSVDFNVPKIKNLRNLSFETHTDEQVKNSLVSQLLSDPSVLPKLSVCDRDYLFIIAVSAIHLGEIKVKVTCSACNTTYDVVYRLNDKELIELPEGSPAVVSRDFGDYHFDYTILSVKDERQIIDYALSDFDHYAERYEDGVVARTLGFDISDDGVRRANDLPVHYYYSALLFQQLSFHGVDNIVHGICTNPACKHESLVVVPFTKSILSTDTTSVINSFMSVSKIMDFQSFLDLSMPEFKAVMQNIESGAI